MSCLKMYMTDPKPKGIPCPEGCRVVRFRGDEDIPAWVDICRSGGGALIGPDEDGYAKFRRELIDIDGPDPLRDTYFIECAGEKAATFTAVPDMWSTGMGYIHMVACKEEFRGLGIGKFMSDYAVKLLTDIGKKRLFLLSSEAHFRALGVYIKEGFSAADDGRTNEELADQLRRWQAIVDKLGVQSLDFLNFDGSYNTTLHPSDSRG